MKHWIGIGVVLLTVQGLTLASNASANPALERRPELAWEERADYAIEWKESETEIRRPEYAKISLKFDAAASPMQAACYYKYDTADENVMTHSTPLSAYATVPYRMTVNGKEVEERILHEAIQEAARKQGRELVEGVKKGVDEAVRAAKEQTR